jgi:hypothetical protein
MTPLHPVTKASLNHAYDLAKAVAASHPGYYGTVPLAYLALRIRETLRFCEDCGLWEPADLALIVQAMFRPAPELLPPVDRDYAIRTLMNTGTTPQARARTVALALGGTLPPAAIPHNMPRT